MTTTSQTHAGFRSLRALTWTPWLIFVLATLLSASALAEVVVVELRPNSGKEADFQSAKAAAKDAQEAFSNGDMTAAAAHGESAYRSYPNASTALQLAAIYGAADNSKEAYYWFLTARNYNPLKTQLALIDEGLKKHGEALKVGTIHLDATPLDASVSIDSGAAKAEAGRYIGLSYGEHSIVVSADNHLPVTKTITVKGAGVTTASFTLERVQVQTEPADGQDITVPLALVISGAVVAGAGAGVLVWGLSSGSDANSVNGSFSSGQSAEEAAAEYNGLKGDAEAGTYAGYGLLGVGGALIVTGAVLWALLPGEAEGKGATNVSAAPALLPGGGGLIVNGSF